MNVLLSTGLARLPGCKITAETPTKSSGLFFLLTRQDKLVIINNVAALFQRCIAKRCKTTLINKKANIRRLPVLKGKTPLIDDSSG